MISVLLDENFPPKFSDCQGNVDFNDNILPPVLAMFQIKVKVGLSPSKKFRFICFNESPLKMMKNAFYFILKLFFFSKYLNFCLDILVI